MGLIQGDTRSLDYPASPNPIIRVIKGDAGSLDSSSYKRNKILFLPSQEDSG